MYPPTEYHMGQFHHPPNSLCWPFLVNSSPTPTHRNNWSVFHSCNFAFWRNCHIHVHMMCTLFCLAQHNTSKIHLNYCMCQYCILFHCWVVFHCMGFPGGASGEELDCQCRRRKRHGFSSWVGKIPWRQVWQPTPVFLSGESHGQRSLVSYSL